MTVAYYGWGVWGYALNLHRKLPNSSLNKDKRKRITENSSALMTCLKPEKWKGKYPNKFNWENYYTVPLGELNIVAVCVCVCVCYCARVCLTPYEVRKSITWYGQIPLVLHLKSLHMQVSRLLRAFLLLQNQKETNVYLTTIAPKIRIAVMNWMSSSVGRENFRVRDIFNFLSLPLPSFLPSV